MRTDIVIEDKAAKKLTILDAKYYEATTVENAPAGQISSNSSSMKKQFQ